MEKIIEKQYPLAPFVVVSVLLHYNAASEEWRVKSLKNDSDIQEFKILECEKFQLMMKLLGLTHDEDVELDVFIVRKKKNAKDNRFTRFVRAFLGLFFNP